MANKEDSNNDKVATAGSNGHSQEGTQLPFNEKQFTGWLSGDDFGNVVQTSGVPSAIEKFVEAGDTYKDMSLRANFRNDAHVNKTVLLYKLAEKHHYEDLKQAIMHVISSRPSINGDRINILLKAVVGQLEQENKKGGLNKFRSLILGQHNEGKNQ